ncbi:MAG: hypothetical protein QM784_39025 [Polyangiaceae bacterium]
MSKRIRDQKEAPPMPLGKAAIDDGRESVSTTTVTPDQGVEQVLAQLETKIDFVATTATAKRDEPLGQGLSVGWVTSWAGEESVSVTMLDGKMTRAKLLPQLERAVLEEAIVDGQLVLLASHGGKLTVMGSICTRKPKTLKLEAEHVELTAAKSVLLKAGRAALELRQDGNVELVGSRISAVSRGLFRIVGRMLRLN